MDSPSSSPSERLSVVCSVPTEYSSNSSDGSSPNSRRNSVSDPRKDEQYWERRRKNNDASRRCRERRRNNDMLIEEKLLVLSRENERLKNELEQRGSSERPSVVTSSTSSGNLRATQTTQSTLFSPNSAFQPFRPKESVIMKAERTSPDSSSDHRIERVIQQAPPAALPIPSSASPPTLSLSSLQQPPAVAPPSIASSSSSSPSTSLLSTLLSARRPSPSVPQSRTEQNSGLNSPPRNGIYHMQQMCCSKSDCESISSSASLSPSHSSEDHHDNCTRIGEQSHGVGKSQKPIQYLDRRRRNNEAAKRCRANRRAVFEYRSRRVQLLEGENDQLKEEISKLKQEVEQFKSLLSAQSRGPVNH
ncbi:hypothetical protein WR25_04962 [Diploscapter pachys]|uniref:BZIP domain-containing protein n=1 Tax=Diploscapter pachys TaxID=2018661 RepID=A0A2A2JQX3_9BILA|nr:hypothetical protein WR25_04962 [Diploscapter pachys]